MKNKRKQTGNNKIVLKTLCVIFAGLMLLSVLCLFTGCGNRDYIDTNRTYDRAIIEMPGGEVMEVNVRQWRDYDGEQFQIIATDGTVYLVNSVNCVLIRD